MKTFRARRRDEQRMGFLPLQMNTFTMHSFLIYLKGSDIPIGIVQDAINGRAALIEAEYFLKRAGHDLLTRFDLMAEEI